MTSALAPASILPLALAAAHVRMRLLTLLRIPAYVAGTLATPSVILVFLGPGLADTTAQANAVMASFTVFAVMGVAFFQFGVGIAEGRASPWATFERILPAPFAVRLAGAVAPAVLFAAAAAGLVIAVAHLFMPVALDTGAWLRLGLVLTRRLRKMDRKIVRKTWYENPEECGRMRNFAGDLNISTPARGPDAPPAPPGAVSGPRRGGGRG